MAWVRIDDQAPRHPKMLKAGPSACWLWVCALAYAQSHLTDGFIPSDAVPVLGLVGMTRVRRLLSVLVDVGLMESVDGGYQIHDYLTYQQSADEALDRQQAISRKRAIAGRAGGLKRAAAAREKVDLDPSSKQANGKQMVPSKIQAPTQPNMKTMKEPSSSSPPMPPTRPPLTPRPKEYGRLVLHRWQVEALLTTLGPHAEAFDLDAWIWQLDAQAREEGLVIDRRALWPWVQSRLRAECLRRGLPVAQDEQTGPTLTKTSQRMVSMVQKLSGGSA